ncbi:hypothetical protein AKJ63_01610 [candidate division MSBL1 archaeon SCGC-AAA259D18]|uniref:Uncharacterized protein n=1 Tax=candidate division MSBL1 archaeon SCGC-AAA259D18 TaxID=1698262 RepID=A0A133UAV6_9EURY|nr:hypothetical protein AKJ63_01610 [candidate division MSBL1 archaeon SCGC-AAA259D18]
MFWCLSQVAIGIQCLFVSFGGWVFPLGGDKAKIGCGDFVSNPRREVEKYLSEKNCEITKQVGAKIRVIPPSMSRPFYVGGGPTNFRSRRINWNSFAV